MTALRSNSFSFLALLPAFLIFLELPFRDAFMQIMNFNSLNEIFHYLLLHMTTQPA